MKKTNIRHLIHYLLLLIIMVSAVISVSLFSARPAYQAISVVLASLGYIAWGLIHHHKEKTLYKEVALEYILLGILGVTASLGLIYYL
jgi:hypothetical protein